MPNKNISISDYSVKTSDIFFFDNNIWMYILCPLANFQKGKRQTIYSRFLNNIMGLNAHIYTTSLILSEFSNRYLRLDYDLARKDRANAGKYNDYKRDFVGTPRFCETVIDVKNYLNQIIKICQKSGDEFNSINLNEVLSSFTNIGFNDSYYIQLSSKKNWIIVSDDSDFTSGKIPDNNLTILSL
jgi:hypothetical protein